MPRITVKGDGSFDVEQGKRLVLALEDNGIDILHKCGGYAKCTTCRVYLMAGEPDKMTVAEHDRLSQDEGLLGSVRLSCQMTADQDMTVSPIFLVSEMDTDSPGKRPEDHITPEPEWMDAPRG